MTYWVLLLSVVIKLLLLDWSLILPNEIHWTSLMWHTLAFLRSVWEQAAELDRHEWRGLSLQVPNQPTTHVNETESIRGNGRILWMDEQQCHLHESELYGSIIHVPTLKVTVKLRREPLASNNVFILKTRTRPCPFLEAHVNSITWILQKCDQKQDNNVDFKLWRLYCQFEDVRE